MSRVYGEPVDVVVSGGRPVRFVWRGQLYVVRRVLEHWVTTREWRRRVDREAEGPTERRFWRIEAVTGDQVGVYELRLDTATGRWLLSRAWD
ncbi:MAG: nucleotidyltransferase [Streptosporangiales bacterium]|nr:nucleotidyltransferase [Streptosporangiales bacterium]